MAVSERKKLEEVCVGYGFDPIEQHVDGIYCTGCYTIHKRPTKMYSNGPKPNGGEVLCRYQVIHLYWNEADHV